MASVFASISIPSAEPAPTIIADWSAIKQQIASGVDLRAEFAELGVRFTGHTTGDKLECFAVDRDEDVASAVVFGSTGKYYDSGAGGDRAVHLVDLAVRLGRFPKWSLAVKHYAEKAGVPLGPVRESRGRYPDGHFDYHDPSGAVAYRVFRYITATGDKTFSQAPPDGRGGWKYRPDRPGGSIMDGVDPVPYRLGSFPEPGSDYLWIVEGEKACEALAGLGLRATTAHGGSGSARKNWPLVARHFAGQDVVIFPDNDPGGEKYADEACRALDGVAASIRRLRFLELPRKGDAVEWIEANAAFSAESQARCLQELADACPAWDASRLEAAEDPSIDVADELGRRDATAEDLLRVMSEEAWFWKGWIPTCALTLLAAQAGKGKTRFLMDLHRRICTGQPWPDGSVPKNIPENPKVLWVAGDRQYRELRDIPEKFGIPRDQVILNAYAKDPFGGRMLENEEQWTDLEERIERVRPAFVAIDTITKTGHFKSQDPVDAMRQYGPLMDIAVRQQVPIICVTHLSKSGNALGVRAVESVRAVIQLSHPDPDQADRRKLWVEKSFDEIPPPLGITLTGEGNDYDASPPEEPAEAPATGKGPKGPRPPSPKVVEAAEWLGALLGEQTLRVKAIRDAAEARDISAGALYKAKDLLGIVETVNDRDQKLWSKAEAA